MLGFKILIDGVFDEIDVEVIYSDEFKRAMLKNKDTEEFIETQWNAKVHEAKEKGIKIFNGPLFRLNDLRSTDNKQLILELGRTDYKEYVGTRTEEFHHNNNFRTLANPLAICAAIISREGKIVVERRGEVDVYSGQYHVIGGFMDRSFDFVGNIPSPFKAIRREIKEEIGLSLKNTRLLLGGIAYDLITPHPEMCFFVEVDLSCKDISDIFLTHEVDQEVHRLEFIGGSKDELIEFITSHHGSISVTGEACMVLYGKHRYGVQWYQEIMSVLSLK